MWIFAAVLLTLSGNLVSAHAACDDGAALVQDIYTKYGIRVQNDGSLSKDEFGAVASILETHLDTAFSPAFITKAGLKVLVLTKGLDLRAGVVDPKDPHTATVALKNLGPVEDHESAFFKQLIGFAGTTAAEPDFCLTKPGAIDDLICASGIENNEKLYQYYSQWIGIDKKLFEDDVNTLKNDVTRTFDHELFHVIDFNHGYKYASDEGLIHSSTSKSWIKLNPPGFNYLGSGLQAIKQGHTLEPQDNGISEFKPGFVSEYASSAIIEDRAEVFSWFMTYPKQFLEVAKSDSILAAKLQSIKSALNSFLRPAELPQPFH